MATFGRVSMSQATFSPAAAAHGAADVIGVAQEFKGISQMTGGGVLIMSASLQVNSATALTTVWKLHMYSVTPPSAFADNDLFDIPAGDQSSYLGFVDIAQLTDVGSTLFIQSDNLNKAIRPNVRSVFGYLVATSAITTAAVAHIVTLHTVG